MKNESVKESLKSKKIQAEKFKNSLVKICVKNEQQDYDKCYGFRSTAIKQQDKSWNNSKKFYWQNKKLHKEGLWRDWKNNLEKIWWSKWKKKQ